MTEEICDIRHCRFSAKGWPQDSSRILSRGVKPISLRMTPPLAKGGASGGVSMTEGLLRGIEGCLE